MKKCKKTTKTKLYLTRNYLNCHPNRNSLTFHQRNTKNIFHIFSKQKHNRSTKRSDCSTFLPKILCHCMQQNRLEITFRIILTLFTDRLQSHLRMHEDSCVLFTSRSRGGVKLFPQCIAIWALHYILLIFRHSSLIVRLACVVFASLLTD